MDDGPDPANKKAGEKHLGDTNAEGVALEAFLASTGRDHGADARCEGDAVEDQADESESLGKDNNSVFAAVCGFIGHYVCLIRKN